MFGLLTGDVQAHAEFVSSLTEEHEQNAREIESKYQAKLRALQAQNDLRRKTELHELEERKSKQVHTLMKNHEKAFSDIKNYYNDITANNMALINTLKVVTSPSSRCMLYRVQKEISLLQVLAGLVLKAENKVTLP